LRFIVAHFCLFSSHLTDSLLISPQEKLKNEERFRSSTKIKKKKSIVFHFA
jgi:hypothetical protein